MAVPFALQLQRLYADSLDPDFRMSTAQRNAYLTDATRYGGQIVWDTEEEILYTLSEDKTEWKPVGGGDEFLKKVNPNGYSLDWTVAGGFSGYRYVGGSGTNAYDETWAGKNDGATNYGTFDAHYLNTFRYDRPSNTSIPVRILNSRNIYDEGQTNANEASIDMVANSDTDVTSIILDAVSRNRTDGTFAKTKFEVRPEGLFLNGTAFTAGGDEYVEKLEPANVELYSRDKVYMQIDSQNNTGAFGQSVDGYLDNASSGAAFIKTIAPDNNNLEKKAMMGVVKQGMDSSVRLQAENKVSAGNGIDIVEVSNTTSASKGSTVASTYLTSYSLDNIGQIEQGASHYDFGVGREMKSFVNVSASAGQTSTKFISKSPEKQTTFEIKPEGLFLNGNPFTAGGGTATAHTHAISDITNLQTELNGKAASSHTHTGYASSTHTHAISDVTNLQTTLNGKANTSHTHSEYALTGHTHSDIVKKVNGQLPNAAGEVTITVTGNGNHQYARHTTEGVTVPINTATSGHLVHSLSYTNSTTNHIAVRLMGAVGIGGNGSYYSYISTLGAAIISNFDNVRHGTYVNNESLTQLYEIPAGESRTFEFRIRVISGTPYLRPQEAFFSLEVVGNTFAGYTPPSTGGGNGGGGTGGFEVNPNP